MPKRKVEVSPVAAAQSCCAVCCGYRLAAAQSCCAVCCGYRLGALLSPTPCPQDPPLLRQGYLTLDCPTQKFPPSAAALQRMAGRFTRCWRGLANGTVPGVD